MAAGTGVTTENGRGWNLTRAALHRCAPRLTLAILVISLAACGDTAVSGSTNPPYASPQASAPAVIASRGCEKVKAGQAPNGTATVKVMLINPGTDLQRVSNDLAGNVPGGNITVDATIAGHDADAFYTWLGSAALCEPLRSQLIDKAGALKDAYAALAASAGSPGAAAAALPTAQAAYKALSDLVDNPPSG
jgi:hypothetical protein